MELGSRKTRDAKSLFTSPGEGIIREPGSAILFMTVSALRVLVFCTVLKKCSCYHVLPLYCAFSLYTDLFLTVIDIELLFVPILAELIQTESGCRPTQLSEN